MADISKDRMEATKALLAVIETMGNNMEAQEEKACIASISSLLETADVNAKMPGGELVLHAAIRKRKFDVVKLLLKHGADANAVEEGCLDYSPLHTVITTFYNMKKSTEAWFKLLLDNDADPADPNALDFSGCSVLLQAIMHGYPIKILELLVKKDADIHLKGKDGLCLALKESVVQGDKEYIDFFIEKGAGVYLTGKEGSRYLALARANGTAFVSFIEERIATVSQKPAITPRSIG